MNTAVRRPPDGLLRGPSFDGVFIVGLALLALASGAAVTAQPGLFWPILTLDLWLLGYHHVIATFTRLTFDRESFREHRSLILYLPWAVATAVLAIALTAGLWLLVSVYLYWQWFHYARQSEGIAKAYAGRSTNMEIGNARIARLAFYSVPVARHPQCFARAPDEFLFMPVRHASGNRAARHVRNDRSGFLLTAWLGYQVRAWRHKRLAGPYVAYVTSHFVVFAVAYIGLKEINYGWLAINMWQYSTSTSFSCGYSIIAASMAHWMRKRMFRSSSANRVHFRFLLPYA